MLRAYLGPHGVDGLVDARELQLHEKFINEITGSEKRLSTAILDVMFPKQATPCDLYHYTSLDGLRGIASSGELRLYAIRKRIGQGELEQFARDHQLQGYLNAVSGPPFFEELSDDLFYISMTGLPPTSPLLMWGCFAQGTGVRLQIKVATSAAELRPTRYEQASNPTLLSEINAALEAIGEPPFVPWTISKIGAFYLPCTLASEDEVRLLIKRYSGGPNPVKNDGAYSYWPIALSQDNDFVRADVLGLHIAPGGDSSTVAAAIAGTVLAGVPVTGP